MKKLSKLLLFLVPINFALLLAIARKLKKIVPSTNGGENNAKTNPPPPIIPATNLQPPESNQSGNPPENKNDRWKKADVIINAITLFVLILTLFAVSKYTLEAGRQTKISRKLFQASERSYKLAQRAWIFMPQEIKNQEIAFNKPLGVPFEIKNTGETPAKTIYAYIAVDIVKPDDVINFSYEQGNKRRPHLKLFYPFMFPKASRAVTHFALRPGENPEKIIVTPELISEINAEDPKVRVVMHGRITYNDIFGDPHWIKFCAQSNPTPLGLNSKSGKQCVNHNDIDTQK